MSHAAPAATLIANERAKLTATWLNTLAGGFILVGGVTPLVGVLYGVTLPRAGPALGIVLTLLFIVLGVALHLVGRRILGGLQA